MGLATIELHSQKVQNKLYKIPKPLSVNRPKSKQDTAIWREHTEIHKIPKFGVNQASLDWDIAI